MTNSQTRKIDYIYALRCPFTGAVRYIGKAKNVQRRLASHLRDARTRNRPVCNWIAKLIADGATPTVETLCSTWDWCHSERELIAQYRADGHDLLNLSDGGVLIHNSPEKRKRAAQDMNAKRLPHVWGALRYMGATLAGFRRAGHHALVDELERKMAIFRGAVEQHRRAGTLNILEARLQERAEKGPTPEQKARARARIAEAVAQMRQANGNA